MTPEEMEEARGLVGGSHGFTFGGPSHLAALATHLGLALNQIDADKKRRGDDETLMRMAADRMHSLLLFDEGEGIPNSLKDVERLLRFIAARLGEGPNGKKE
jgi:hypothetical protein